MLRDQLVNLHDSQGLLWPEMGNWKFFLLDVPSPPDWRKWASTQTESEVNKPIAFCSSHISFFTDGFYNVCALRKDVHVFHIKVKRRLKVNVKRIKAFVWLSDDFFLTLLHNDLETKMYVSQGSIFVRCDSLKAKNRGNNIVVRKRAENNKEQPNELGHAVIGWNIY